MKLEINLKSYSAKDLSYLCVTDKVYFLSKCKVIVDCSVPFFSVLEDRVCKIIYRMIYLVCICIITQDNNLFRDI